MKFRLHQLLISILLINAAMFISCSKEEELNLPKITWYSPGENATFSALDTVLISANIQDDEKITLIRITLKSENNIPVQHIRDIRPNERTYDLRVEFPLVDAELDGRYYFDITAYDEQDYASSYRFVNITAIPLEVEDVFIFNQLPTTTDVFMFDDGILNKLTSLTGDLLGSELDQKHRQVYGIGRFTAGITGFDPEQGIEIWSYKTGVLPQVPIFNDHGLWDNYLFASREDGRILAFTESGSLYYESLLENGFKPDNILLHESDVVVFEQIDRSSGQSTVKSEYFPSGLNKGDVWFPYGQIVSMHSIAWDEVLILSNQSNKQFLSIYNSEEHFISKVDEGTEGGYGAVEEIDENTLVLTRGNDLVKLNLNDFLFSTLKKNYSPEVIQYNKADLNIFCAKDQRLDLIDVDNGAIYGSWNLNIDISSIEIMYNR